MISPSLSSSQTRPRLPPAGHPTFSRRPTSDVTSDASATPSPSPPPSVTSSTGEKSSSGKMTNFSIAAIMNNRRNAEEFLDDEKEIDVKRRKIISETTSNNMGK